MLQEYKNIIIDYHELKKIIWFLIKEYEKDKFTNETMHKWINSRLFLKEKFNNHKLFSLFYSLVEKVIINNFKHVESIKIIKYKSKTPIDSKKATSHEITPIYSVYKQYESVVTSAFEMVTENKNHVKNLCINGETTKKYIENEIKENSSLFLLNFDKFNKFFYM